MVNTPLFQVCALFLCILMTACQHDNEPSYYCRDQVVTDAVDKVLPNLRKRKCATDPIDTSDALINFNSEREKDPNIIEWEKNSKVAWLEQKKWKDNSGYWRFVVFNDIEKECIVVESIRVTKRESLIYSRKICSVKLDDKILPLVTRDRFLQQSINWGQETKCKRKLNCERGSVRFQIQKFDGIGSNVLLDCKLYKLAGDSSDIVCSPLEE